LADIFKANLRKDFLGLIDIFVSSDGQSVPVGNRWLDDVDAALARAKVQIILCSQRSVGRPWLNFEAGAGWVRKIPVVPICHTGMRPSSLPIPLNMLQGIEASDEAGLRRVYELLAMQLGSMIPTSNFGAIAQEIKEIEHRYGLIMVVRDAVRRFLEIEPGFRPVFMPVPTHRIGISDEVFDWQLRQMLPHLNTLKDKGMLDYTVGAANFSIGRAGGGVHHRLQIELGDGYYEIAGGIMT
jgi:hypothetical protein